MKQCLRGRPVKLLAHKIISRHTLGLCAIVSYKQLYLCTTYGQVITKCRDDINAKQSKATIEQLRLWDTRARTVRNVLGNAYLSSLTKNLWYEQREQFDSRG